MFFGDRLEAILDGEVTGIEPVQFRLRQIAQVRLAALRREEDVVLSPEDQRLRLPIAQELLPRRIAA